MLKSPGVWASFVFVCFGVYVSYVGFSLHNWVIVTLGAAVITLSIIGMIVIGRYDRRVEREIREWNAGSNPIKFESTYM